MGDGLLSRRDFVKGVAVAGAVGALGAGALAGFLPVIGPDPLPARPIVRRASPDSEPVSVRVADLAGDPVVALVGEWHGVPALVYKVKVATLQASSLRRGYNTGQFAVAHPTEDGMALLAYGGKCTHLGCTLSGFNKSLGASKDVQDYDDDGVPEGRILCPCHSAQFDIFDLGKNVPATPGPRPIDAMGIRLGPDLDGSPTIDGLWRVRQDSYRSADKQGNGAAFRLAS